VILTESPKKRKAEVFLEPKVQDLATVDLLKWIVDDYQAFIVVENKYFQSFTQKFGYELPGRTSTKNQIVMMYEECKKRILEEFKELNSKVSLTLDMWTSGTGTPYLGITAHWINSLWRVCSITLDFLECPYPHDGESLAIVVLKAVKEFEIIGKIIGFTTDNASNMTTFYNSIYEKIKLYSPQVTSFGCGCHIINLAVVSGVSELSISVENLRNINKKLKDSPKLYQEFKSIYDNGSFTFSFKTPKLDVKTRWNSFYYMINDSLGMKEIYNRMPETKLVETEWETLSELSKFLEFYEELTNYMSGQKYPTISLLYKIISLLFEKTRNIVSTNQDINRAALKMLTYFEKYWGELKFAGLIASVIDPRLKNEIITTFPDIKERLATICLLYKNTSPLTQKIVSKSFLVFDIIDLDSQDSVSNEIETYCNLNLGKIDPNCFDILVWWNAHSLDFPILAKIARDYLSIQVSSSPSERLFSQAGDVITDDRNRLSPDTAQALVCLKSWNQYLDNK